MVRSRTPDGDTHRLVFDMTAEQENELREFTARHEGEKRDVDLFVEMPRDDAPASEEPV